MQNQQKGLNSGERTRLRKVLATCEWTAIRRCVNQIPCGEQRHLGNIVPKDNELVAKKELSI